MTTLNRKPDMVKADQNGHDMRSVGAPCLLVLDDDRDVGETIAAMARTSGTRALATDDPDEFFSLLAQEQPTHIALDLIMPKMDGISIFQRLNDENCKAGIIIVSGADQRVIEASARSAQEHGLVVAGSMSKPFSARHLRTILAISKQEEPERAARAEVASQDQGGSEVQPKDVLAALDRDRIHPVFQPKVRCADGALVGFEALSRWSSDAGIAPTPDEFIPVAETGGLIDRLTEAIVDRAVSWLSENFKQDMPTIAINISARSLTDARVLDVLKHTCDRHAIPLDRIVVEVTESGMLGHTTEVLDILTRMRLKGIQLSIDDFGVGYSSMVQLARMPFSELKIDKSFVSTLGHSAESRTIVSAIIGMARGLGLSTVAEGVEDLNTFSFLQELGCDVAQGFFIGRPMSADDAPRWAV